MKTWGDYKRTAEKGPTQLFWKVFLPILTIIVVIGIIGYVLGWFGEAARVAKEEFAPRAALEKYEWFINQANAIEKMQKDVELFNTRLEGVDEQYISYGKDKSAWPPHIQVQYNKDKQQAREDLVAMKSQYNGLVREYNANSEKFNWKLFQTNPDKPKERFHEYAL